MRLVLISLFVKLHLIFGLKILLNVTKKLEIVYFQDIMDNLAQGGGVKLPLFGVGAYLFIITFTVGANPSGPNQNL